MMGMWNIIRPQDYTSTTYDRRIQRTAQRPSNVNTLYKYNNAVSILVNTYIGLSVYYIISPTQLSTVRMSIEK